MVFTVWHKLQSSLNFMCVAFMCLWLKFATVKNILILGPQKNFWRTDGSRYYNRNRDNHSPIEGMQCT